MFTAVEGTGVPVLLRYRTAHSGTLESTAKMILPAHGRNPLNFRPQHVLARAIQAGPIFDQLLDKAVYPSAAG